MDVSVAVLRIVEARLDLTVCDIEVKLKDRNFEIVHPYIR